MRSLDGGRTWGGLTPGDNIPFPVSQKTLISGIGCHVAIGPKGEVYITWYDNQLNALMQAKSNNRGRLWSLAVPIAGITGVNEPFAGEAFRNLSIPSTAVDGQGNVYVVAASRNGQGTPLLGNLPALGRQIKQGAISVKGLQDLLTTKKANNLAGVSYKAGGDGLGPMSGSDIMHVQVDRTAGAPTARPVRVNQDPPNGDADQFQPWLAVTPSGQVNVSFFDRRNDPANYFIDTWLARSEDGGRTFTDRRVSQRTWDPAVNAPTSVSGKFIGDYQGLVADDEVAIPFWNDTQLAALPESDPERSPYQEVFAARVPEGAETPVARTRCFARRLTSVRARSAASRCARRAPLVGRRIGPPARTARGVLRYCVKGGGSVVMAFDAKGRVSLAATTARGHKRSKIGRGSSLQGAARSGSASACAAPRPACAASPSGPSRGHAVRGASRQGDVCRRRRQRAAAKARRAHHAAAPRRPRAQALSAAARACSRATSSPIRSQARRAKRTCSPRPTSRKPSRMSGLRTGARRETTWMRNSTAPSSSHFQTAKSIWPRSTWPASVP